MAAAEFYGYGQQQRQHHDPNMSFSTIPSSQYSSRPGPQADSPAAYTPAHDVSPLDHPPHSLGHVPSNNSSTIVDSRNNGGYAEDIALRPYDQELANSPVYSKYNKQERVRQSRGPDGTADEVAREERRRRRRTTTLEQATPPPEKKGFLKGRIPWVCYIMTLIQLVVFVVELVKNGIMTQTPIQIKPQFNPMIGPSIYNLINMGARYVPCMKALPSIPSDIGWPCPNTTTSDPSSPSNHCSLSDLCGLGGFGDPPFAPNQWYRFIIPIFLHAGIVHIAFNLLLQLTLGREMERIIGSVRFLIVYLSSGIFGFVLGGNFAAQGIASMGASGALFGIIAIMLLDLLYAWNDRKNPGKELAFIIVDIVISFVLGLLPGLDNFSHIGGFLMGLVLGICILHSPNRLREAVGSDEPPYMPVDRKAGGKKRKTTRGYKEFAKNPVGFFKGRKGLWWAWWLVRAGALIAVIICFIILLQNFYVYQHTCSWCKYLSCLPVPGWCDVGNITIDNYTKPAQPNKRWLLKLTGRSELRDFF